MGINAIISRINEDADTEAARIRAIADTKAEEIRTTGAKEAEDEYTAIINRGKQKIRQNNAQMRSQVLITTRKMVREEKESLISRCFFLATEELQNVSTKRGYQSVLKWLITDGIQSIRSEKYIISVNEKDKQIAEQIVSDLRIDGRDISLTPEVLTAMGGAIIKSTHGISVDNTIEARLGRYRKELLYKVSLILFGEER